MDAVTNDWIVCCSSDIAVWVWLHDGVLRQTQTRQANQGTSVKNTTLLKQVKSNPSFYCNFYDHEKHASYFRAWASAEIFVRGGVGSKKASNKDHKWTPHSEKGTHKEKQVAERPPHREKGPP